MLHNCWDHFFCARYVPGGNLDLFLGKVKHAAERCREVGGTYSTTTVYGISDDKNLPEEFQCTMQAICRWPDNEFADGEKKKDLSLPRRTLQTPILSFLKK